MAQSGARPVPARRKLNVDMSSKTKLVQSFAGFNSSTVPEEHILLARRCIGAISARSARYEYVPFHMILQWNQEKSNPYSMIAQACDLLLKYVVNLLKPKRPPVWRSIKITNSHFCARVDCMVGARDILEKIGYSETLPTAMQFPEQVKEPDKEKLQVIAAELLMAKLEVEGLQGQGVPPTRQLSNPASSLSQQPSSPGTPTTGSEPHSLSPSLPLQTAGDGSFSLAHQPPYTGSPSQPPPAGWGNTGSENGHSLGSPRPSLQSYPVRPPPTEAFTPHPRIASNYEQPILRNAPDTPPTARPSSEQASPDSSGDSSYGTPPSSTSSPNTTSEQVEGNVAASYQSQLKIIQMKRDEIKEKMKRSVATAAAALSSRPAPEGRKASQMAVRSTSYQGPTTEAPSLPNTAVGAGEKTHQRQKPSHFSPIIEEEPVIRGAGTGPQTQPVSSAAPVSSGGQISGTPCPRCSHIVQAGLSACDYCSVPVPRSATSMLPPPIHSETSLMRLHPAEPRAKPPLRASAASAEEAIMQHRRQTQAFPAPRKEEAVPAAPPLSGGATGGSKKSFLESYDEKMEAWKREWRKRGYSEDEIPPEPASVPLPEFKKKVPPRKPPQEKKKKKKGKSALDDLERYQREAERKEKMEQIGSEGEALMECVKFCVKHSYAVEEVVLAYKNSGKDSKESVLRYLRQTWAKSIRDLQDYVVGMVDRCGRSVGRPSDVEARRYLVLSNGDVIEAGNRVYRFRRKKIEELQCKFRVHQQLDWEPAVLGLSVCDMDVERAVCSIQCETLQPLYEFIFSEWTQVPATDMKNIKKRLKNGEGEGAREANLRMLMGEFKLPTLTKAGMAVDLMNRVEVDDTIDYPLSYYVDAAKDFSSLEEAERGLIKECPICTLEFPVHETITMPGCTDTFCKDCFKGHFTVVVKEKGVKHFNCPMCDQPDMTNRDDAQDLYQELFVHMIHEHLPEHYDLVQTKLAERNLQKDPGFRWCANDKCGNCFINPNPQRKKIQCPTCNQLMCFQCKKPWEDQHNGVTCEAFAEWKRQNDPKFQKEGLAAHLQANGIECPDCQMRYELARGGCMHFKCTRCPNEFCSGCGGSFKKAQLCGRFRTCANKGLHAHHPRDCLYFMRDFSVDQLQTFLRQNAVEFETQPSPEQLEAAQREAGEEKEGAGENKEEEAPAQEGERKAELKCSVMLQKELVDKLVDEPCGDTVKEGHAGLCEKHYKEYLVDRINNAKLDPLPLYEQEGNVETILMREEKPIPEKEEDETDEKYKERLLEHIKQEVPLQRGKPAAAAAAQHQPEPLVQNDPV